jgi:hypothetical protein
MGPGRMTTAPAAATVDAARLPRRFRAFYRLSDARLRDLGLERRTLPLFRPVLTLLRDDLF